MSHLHDNFGGDTPSDDLHLPLGAGSIHFEPIIHELCTAGYDSTFTLEIPPHSLPAGKEKLQRMLAPFTRATTNHSSDTT